jgi:hypothetical protein
MAGHVAFGARTGGAPIILGIILLVLAFCFSGSVGSILAVFPRSVLGIILFLAGAQLALGSCDFGERFITLATAAFAMWNVGLALMWVWPSLTSKSAGDCACKNSFNLG